MKEINILNLIKDYTENDFGLIAICEKYHIGKLKAKALLKANGIEIKKKGKQALNNNEFIIKDFHIKKYKEKDNHHFEAYDKLTNFRTKDYMNSSGILTSYIKKEYNIEIPTLYDRRLYYMRTGNYWWEQWLTIEEVENTETKKCPYCDWETKDVENKSGAFEVHLITKHNLTKLEYLKKYPDDVYYFQLSNKTLDLQMEKDNNKFVICKICGKKLKKITTDHLKKHNITKEEYILKYGLNDLVSKDYHDFLSKNAININKNMERNFSSKQEKEIKTFIESFNIECKSNRKILNGKELDIFISSKNVAIEYNGLLWHSEKFNKNKDYHLNKLKECNKQGIKLIQIFEDEYIEHKDIVFNKIAHIIGVQQNLPKIMGRKCKIEVIDRDIAESFLNDYHIQGYARSTIYLGAIYDNNLIGVMTFKQETKGSNKWELTRFASDYHYICQGVGGKLFNWFIKNYNPSEVKSFADRRWTLDKENNLYTKLGFNLLEEMKPEYRYYNSKVDKYKRFHKFGFRKQILHRKYGFPLSMTETEMVKELGYNRIWDCGLFKFVWKRND